MEGFWYYAIDNKSTGPFTFPQLTAALSGLSQPRDAMLWHASFDNWRRVYDVPEVIAIMPDLAQPPPLRAELRVPPIRDYGSERNEPKKGPEKASWRKSIGTLVSVVIFAIAFGVVREVSHTSTSPKRDPAEPISGSTRESFSKAAIDSCLKKQESDPDNISLKISHETLVNYCSCYVDALTKSTTYGDIESYNKDGKMPPQLQAKTEKAGLPCSENLQRKLLGGGGK